MIQGELIASNCSKIYPQLDQCSATLINTQDMYLAGSFLLLLAVVLVVGNLLADIVLAWIDPRIRYD